MKRKPFYKVLADLLGKSATRQRGYKEGTCLVDQCDLSDLLYNFDRVDKELRLIKLLVDTPELNDFPKAVLIEAVHQRRRWPEGHDENKTVSDWIRLLQHLNAKIGVAAWDDDIDKMKHHVITLAAVGNNFHAEILRREKLDDPHKN